MWSHLHQADFILEAGTAYNGNNFHLTSRGNSGVRCPGRTSRSCHHQFCEAHCVCTILKCELRDCSWCSLEAWLLSPLAGVPIAVVMNHHKLSGLKRAICSLVILEFPKFKVMLDALMCFSSEGSEWESVSCFFWFAVAWSAVTSVWSLLLWSCCFCFCAFSFDFLPYFYKHTCHWSPSHLDNWVGLPHLQSLTLFHR